MQLSKVLLGLCCIKAHAKDGITVSIPKSWHGPFVHTAQHLEFENFRQSLFWSIRDLRQCTQRIGDPNLQQKIRKDLNSALIESIRKNEKLFTEQMKK